MIDSEGFRANVGIIITNRTGQVFWCRRLGQDSWQFPQGGVNDEEKVEDAMYRELYEEVGLQPKDVKILGQTKNWLRYRLPKQLIRQHSTPLCIGQKQKWFLLRLTADESNVNFATHEKPEFDGFQWVSYWYPARRVVAFKREVYRQAMIELLPFLMQQQQSREHPSRNQQNNKRKRRSRKGRQRG